MLKCHTKGEEKMVKTSKQKTQIQAHHKIAGSETQTHTDRNKRLRARDMNSLLLVFLSRHI